MKARSCNFTVFEKLDLLELVRPYIGVLEEHTNKHSVIIEKNNCWEIIAEKYNAMGPGRPPRTPQGLRTLYKRLKEHSKQELLQCKSAPGDGTLTEATKKLLDIIPQFGNVVNGAANEVKNTKPESIINLLPPPLPPHISTVTVELEQDEEDVKPPPSLLVPPRPEVISEDPEDLDFENTLERSLSPSLSSVDMNLSMSPPLPRIEECFSQSCPRLRTTCACNPETLQLVKKEHQLILHNQKQYGLYIKEKRECLKRRQHLEEELLKAKIKVEKLKALRLRRDLPEYSNL
ncbi:DNA repair and recombination protein RAD54B isoform X2 [Hyla sarda]|uniref:DNA repair and recombination protein RAD54B isoform X2 n=1 Tax=Hyla sarda TaxID=327740 RepID=UPI0024C3D40E|nr:DNA repair and recombination protein RAD54B isoform X2 [Hyla sarda]